MNYFQNIELLPKVLKYYKNDQSIWVEEILHPKDERGKCNGACEEASIDKES